MKKYISIFFILLSTTLTFGQCSTPNVTFASNINYYNAETNWNSISGAYYYRIRYKIIGASNWLFQNNIDSTLTSKVLTNLSPLSDYIWQIKAYCDSTNTSTSSWSVTDTFTTNTSSCPNSNSLWTSSITYYNAVANWNPVPGANRYKIRYKILGATNWSTLGPIHHPQNSTTIPLLQQTTTYEWQLLTYHDSTSLLASLWSAIDTFTTTAFIPAPFNPQLFFGMSSTLCNIPVTFSLRVIQIPNEPDIGTSEITSDGGSFNISSVSAGDTVGTAEIATSTDTITTTLTVGIITSANSAIIYSVDTSGIIGFFTIQNLSGGGVKINSTSPPDGNNYTSGYNSLLIFEDLFITPASPGPLSFIANIDSELNDQFYLVDSSTIIFCNTGLEEVPSERRLLEIANILGEKSMIKQNALLFYIYDDGKVERRIIIE